MDRQLRQGLRDARRGLDPLAEERALRDAVRYGLLPEARLRLAAWLGHMPARRAAEGQAPEPPSDLGAWLRGLGRGPLAGDPALSREASRRAALAAARLAARAFSRQGEDVTALEATLALLGAWLAGEPLDLARSREELGAEGPPSGPQRVLLACLGEQALAETPLEAGRCAAEVALLAATAARALGPRNRQAVRRAIQAELLPWALGL